MIQQCEVRDHSVLQPVTCAKVAVTDEHPQLAASIAEQLRASGVDVQITNCPPVPTDTLIVTAALGDGNASDIHWRALAQTQAFRHAGGKSLILLQDTSGSFCAGPSRGWHSGMAALARTAALEWPELTIRCIDIAVDEGDIAGTTRRLLPVLGSTLTVLGVDLSGQVHSMQAGELLSQADTSVPVPVPASAKETDVWLVSGGARGVTAACIEALAQKVPGRFALLGRSLPAEWPSDIVITDDIKVLRRELAASALAAGERPLPRQIERDARHALAGQEIRDTLRKLEAAGVSARYYPCDISDQQQAADVVARVRNELGQVTALVHGAGVLADSLLLDKTRAQFEHVFETKVGGLQNLLTALGSSPLAFTAFFSSAAAFHGNIGQGDYAMANEVLNRVAQSLKRQWPEATVKSFNWGPWDSGMVDQALAHVFKERGISLIPVQEGAALFADEMLAGNLHRVELLVGDPWAG